MAEGRGRDGPPARRAKGPAPAEGFRAHTIVRGDLVDLGPDGDELKQYEMRQKLAELFPIRGPP